MAESYDEYWQRHPELAHRIELTAFFVQHFDWADQRADWRRLLALARWARLMAMPILAEKAQRAAESYQPRQDLFWELVCNSNQCG